jgi:hypothetical protein
MLPAVFRHPINTAAKKQTRYKIKVIYLLDEVSK